MNYKNISKFKIITLLLITTLTITGCFFNKETNTEPKKENIVLAEMTGKTITLEDLNEEIKTIPAFYRAKFETIQGKQRLLESLTLKELFFKEAIAMKIQNEEKFAAIIDAQQKPTIEKNYIQEKIYDTLEIQDEEAKVYYNENLNQFKILPRIDIKYLEAENDTTAALIKTALEQNVNFYDIMNKYSIDSYAKKHQGNISIKNNKAYISGIGTDSLLFNKINNAPKNEFVGPFKTESGIHFFKVVNKIAPGQEKFEDVKSKIKYRMLSEKKANEYFKFIDELKKEYEISVNESLYKKIDFLNPASSSDIENEILINSNNEKLTFTVKQVFTKFNQLEQERKIQINSDILTWLNNDALKNDLTYVKASEENYAATIQENRTMRKIVENVILREAAKRLISDQIDLSDSTLIKIYNKNIANYTQKKNRAVRAFLFNSKDLAEKFYPIVKKAIADEDLDKIKEVVSTETVFTYKDGIISKIEDGNNIPGFGIDQEFSKIVWNTEINEISPIFKNAKDNFGFVYPLEENEEIVKPFNLVKNNIRNTVGKKLHKEKYLAVKKNLEEKYQCKTYPEKLQVQVSAEKLFEYANKAQKSRKFNEAITYYNQIIDTYENGQDDYKALFMKGFVYSENLSNNEKAIETFEKLLTDYKKGDLHKDAKFMIEFLRDGKELKFEE